MLASDYSSRLEELIGSVSWSIGLPETWHDFFQQTGEATSFSPEQRSNPRVRIRGRGILYHEEYLPMLPRERSPIGIYTRDFSRDGCSFIASYQMWPEETVRIILPTFWLQAKVMRSRRLTQTAYEVGAILLARHDP